MNYYNEFDGKAADWLESLIERGLIPRGRVDRRSIEDVLPDELTGYTQCHFFAGIGGWSRALELAGWPAEKPVWTGSCPCQPFSSAGKGKGAADERHLWPAFHWLIKQCRPEYVFGEQVAGKAGESWFDIVSADLAGEGYTSGLAVLPACSVGAPHIRKRLFWVANAGSAGNRANAGGLGKGEPGEKGSGNTATGAAENGCTSGRVANASGERRQQERGSTPCDEAADGRQPDSDNIVAGDGEGSGADENYSFWANPDWLGCRDGKWRPAPSSIFPLVDGFQSRLGRVAELKGAGNAIVPQVAAAFIEAAVG